MIRLAVAWLLTTVAAAQSPVSPESLCRVPNAAAQDQVHREFGPTFSVVETNHFRVITDACPRHRNINAAVLEQFYQYVRPRFFKGDMKRVVVVYLIDRLDDFIVFCKKQGHPELETAFSNYEPAEHAMYVARTFRNGNLTGNGTLFHEAARAMVYSDFGFTPPFWFDEGFAATFEHARIIKGSLVYGNPHPSRDAAYREAFSAGKIPPLKTFFAMDLAQYKKEIGFNENTSRTLCIWLLRLGEPKLAAYVAMVRNKKSGIEALEAATKKTLPEIEKEWRAHVEAVHFAAAELTQTSDVADAARKYPGYGPLRLANARALLAAGKKEDAEGEARAALEDPRLITPGEAWSVVLNCYWKVDMAKAAEAAQKIVDLQPWTELLDENAFTKLRGALEAQGKMAEAAKVQAELVRLREASERPGR